MADMLVTPEELASFLQRDLDNLPTVELVLQAATGTVQAECRQRLIAVAGDTVVLHVEDSGSWLELPERPVTAVTSVLLGGTAVTDWTLVNDPRTRTGRLWRQGGWTGYDVAATSLTSPRLATVTYSHGYPAGDPGLELARAAVLSLAAAAFENPQQLQAESIDDYQVRWAEQAPALAGLGENLIKALRRRYGVTAGSTALARTALT